MDKILVLFLLIVVNMHNICGQENESHNKYELITLIKDFLETWNQPLKITTSALCWNRKQFYNLTRTFTENGLFVTPSYDKELRTYWPHEQQVFIVDLGCESAAHFLEQAIQQNLFDQPFRWILINDLSTYDIPENLPIYISSKIYIIKKLNAKFHIISKYRLGINSREYHTNNVAMYSINNKTFEYINRLIDGNRTDLQGLVVNASTVIVNPETKNHLYDTREKHVEPFTKVTYPLSVHVLEYVNATANFFYRDTWGYRLNNSKYYVGIIGDFQNRTADIAATPMFVTADRLNFIDPVFVSTASNVRFVFRAPPLSYVQNVYTLPFNKHVWMSCFALTIIIPVFFYTITRWETQSDSFNHHRTKDNNVGRLKPNILDVLQLQIGAICQQGSENEPVSNAGRIATIFLFVAMFFLYTSYSANIVALLQSSSDSIRTVEDLLNTRIELGADDIAYNRYFLKTAPGKVQQALYQQKLAPPGKPENFMSLEEGVKKMRNGYFAFHAELTTIYKCVSDTFIESEKCSLKEIDYFMMFPPHYVILKNSTYRELFRVGLRKMTERGINQRLFKRIYLKRPICQTQGGNFLSVSLIDCYASVLIFGIGVTIAFVIFLLEKAIAQRKTSFMFEYQ